MQLIRLGMIVLLTSILFFWFNTPTNANHEETHLVENVGPENKFVYPHGSFTTDSSACGLCHKLHLATGRNLLRGGDGKIDDPEPEKPWTKRDTCFLCHDGRGSKYDAKNGKYYNSEAMTIVDNVAGGFGSAFTSKHLIEETNSPPGGNGEGFLLVCTSCHNPHGTSNHRNLQININGKNGISVKASKSHDRFTNNEVISYESGVPNFCSACHQDYVKYHNEVGVNDPTKYRHPIEAQLNGGTRTDSDPNGKSVKFEPSLFTTLPTQGAPSGAYPKPTTSTTAGTMGAGTYYYLVTAENNLGESHQGYVKTITIGANTNVQLTWDPITNANSYNVYRFSGMPSPVDTKGLADVTKFKLLASSDSAIDTQKNKFSYNSTSGEIVFVDDGTLSAGVSSPPAINSQGNTLTPKVFCLTCHFAHGTKAVDTFTGESKLKRIDNMGVCQNCHKR